MIIGFGFGSPLVSILMLVLTALASYLLFRAFGRNGHRRKASRAELRRYYYEQRRIARDLSSKFDLTDEEIERKIDEEIGPDA